MAWDDLKLGVKHGRQFNRIALLGSRRWQKVSAGVAGWFTSGEVRYFEEEAQAVAWLRRTA